MSGETISGSTSAIYLNNPQTQNALYIAASGIVYSNIYYAVMGSGSTAWVVDNHGVILDTDPGGVAVGLGFTAGGDVTNSANAEIVATGAGVVVSIGTIVNDGIIESTGIPAGKYPQVYSGVITNAGGTITNASNGLIQGGFAGIYDFGGQDTITNFGTIASQEVGIRLSKYSSSSTIVNAGEISATQANGYAIEFDGSGNRLVVDPGARFVGTVGVANDTGGNVLELASAASVGTIDGIGTQFAGFSSITEDAGAIWEVAGSNSIASGVGVSLGGGAYLEVAGTLTNAGSISGTLLVRGNGVLVNLPGGMVTGAVLGNYGAATLTNLGTVSGSGLGVDFLGGGSVTNGAAGVTGALISGYDGLGIGGGAGTVTNLGTIAATGTRESGVSLKAGGTVTNLAGAVIEGGTGVSGSAGVTVGNAGTIAGSGGTAVTLAGGDDRLAIDPGAVFDGDVVATGVGNTLELAAGAIGGTLAGLGSSFAGFSTVMLDGHARWSLAGGNALAGGSTVRLGVGSSLSIAGAAQVAGSLAVSGSGTLAVAGTGTLEVGTAGGAKAGTITVDAGETLSGAARLQGAVVDNGGIDADGGTLTLAGNLGGSGTIGIDPGSVLDATGRMSLKSLGFLPGGGETLKLGEPRSIATVLSGFGAGDTIDLVGTVVTAEHFAGGVLTLSDAGGTVAMLHFAGSYASHQFVLSSDHHGGTNIGFV